MCRRLASLVVLAAGTGLTFSAAAVAAPGDPFPPGGIDTISDTTGTIYVEALEENIYELEPGIRAFNIMPGPPNETVVVRQDPEYPGGTGYIQTEMVALNLVATDSFFDVIFKLNPAIPSEGHVEEADPGPSDFPAESFFDVYVEVEIPSLTPNPLTNNAPIPLQSLGIEELPPWDKPFEPYPGWPGADLWDGTIWTGLRIISVIHILPPRQECEPDPAQNYQWCTPVDCQELGFPPNYFCFPTLINYNPQDDSYRVVECDCLPEEECHITPGFSGAPPYCIGTCPPPEYCAEYQQPLADQTIDYWCQCDQEQQEGACCDQNGMCYVTTEMDCLATGGMWLGAGTTCSGHIDACCFPDGSCLDADWACCQAMGGTVYAGKVCGALEACCFSDGACKMLDPVCCEDQGGTPQGAGSICTGTTEACCFEDGSCMDLDPICCDDMGGWLVGPGSACLGDLDGDQIDDACQEECEPDPDQAYQWCTPVDCQALGFPPNYFCFPTLINFDPQTGSYIVVECDCLPEEECHITPSFAGGPPHCTGVCPPPEDCVRYHQPLSDETIDFWCECDPPQEEGACCVEDGACYLTTEATCLANGDSWLGAGTTCSGNIDACCLPDGTCIDADWVCCQDMGGTVYPGGACGQYEACCFDDGTCKDMDPLCCIEQGGQRQGPGSACAGFTEACCFDDGSCMDLDPICCDDMGGWLVGPGSACLGDLDGDMIDDACQQDDCHPRRDGLACADVQCPPNEECWPTRVIVNPDIQQYAILECECTFLEDCRLMLDPGAPMSTYCDGFCPPGFVCEHQVVPFDDLPGWYEMWCECKCVCGDINHSGGPVDLNDFAEFAVCYGAAGPTTACPPDKFYCSDMDANGVINLSDFATFATLYGLVSTNSPPNCDQP